MSYSTARASLLSQAPKPARGHRIKHRAPHFAVLALATLFGSASVSHATVLVSDNFAYPNGSLNGQNGGTGWGGNVWFNTNNASVTDGVAGGSGDSSARRNFANTLGTTGTIWVSFDWGNSGAPAENGSYGGLTFYAGQADFDSNQRFLIGNTWPGTGHGLWRMTNSAATAGLNYPGMKTAVAELDLAAGTASLWVGATGVPVDVSGPAMATATGLDLANLGGVRINGLTNTVSQSFDNLVIGTSMTDVAAVPEPSVAILGGLGVLVLLLRCRVRALGGAVTRGCQSAG